MLRSILTIGNAKTLKALALGYRVAVLHLLPAKRSGRNLCPFSSAGCRKVCLTDLGRLGLPAAKQAQAARSQLYNDHFAEFKAWLLGDLRRHIAYSIKRDLIPCIRFGGTHEPTARLWDILRDYPQLQGYDYAKSPHTAELFLQRRLPGNYYITFSRSEDNDSLCVPLIERGCNVAVVWRRSKSEDLPKTWRGFPVVDGDSSDLRFLDPRGVVIGLRAKGSARRDRSGFVLD